MTNILASKLLIIGILILTFIGGTSTASEQKITYTLTPKLSGSPYISVLVDFEGSSKGQTIIELPQNWANGYQEKAIKNIKIEADGKMLDLLDTANSCEKKVVHKTRAKLILSYEVHPDVNHPYDIHRAIINKNLIHAPGYALFVIPHPHEKKSFKIRWHNLPTDWQTLSSHGIKHEFTLSGDNSEFRLRHALYIAGLSRIYKFKIKGSPVYVSLEGTFAGKDEELLDTLKKITTSQRDFFSDYDFPFYFFSLIGTQDRSKAGGTALENCFTAYFPTDFEPKDYRVLIAHEHMHAWIGIKIKKDSLDNLATWWSEGFTEYYARLLLYRSGLISLKEFVSEINSLLQLYYMSPVINEPNTTIERDFWDNAHVEKLPYYRGFVFALWLDSRIKIKTNQKCSLDNVMKKLFVEIQRTKEEFTPQLFNRLTKEVLGEGIEEPLQTFINEGKTISLSNLYPVLPIHEQDIYPFYLGFSQDELVQNKKIKDLDPASEAYKAGLRENDIIEKRDLIKVDDSEQTISVTVKGKTLQFKPRGKTSLKIPQLVINSADEQKQIEKWFHDF